jgi:hypothetical protein
MPARSFCPLVAGMPDELDQKRPRVPRIDDVVGHLRFPGDGGKAVQPLLTSHRV